MIEEEKDVGSRKGTDFAAASDERARSEKGEDREEMREVLSLEGKATTEWK